MDGRDMKLQFLPPAIPNIRHLKLDADTYVIFLLVKVIDKLTSNN